MATSSSASRIGTIAVTAPGRDSGIYQTSPGLLRRRALGPWAEGIAQYMAIRVGDAARGRATELAPLAANRKAYGAQKENLYGENAAINNPHGPAHMLKNADQFH